MKVKKCLKTSFVLLGAFAFFNSTFSAAKSVFPRVDSDLKSYDRSIATKKGEFNRYEVAPENIAWVKLKLAHMVDMDQFTRNFYAVPIERNYSRKEKAYFYEKFTPRFQKIDIENTEEIKKLLNIYPWFTVSRFGVQADRNAWLIVQHADHDIQFQRQVLVTLEKLYPSGETNPTNYAYLFDRVSASFLNPAQRRPQRYGTQGECVGRGKWKPYPLDDPKNLDARRKSVGLGPEADYIKEFKFICH